MASLIQKNFRARKSFAKLKQVIEIPNLIDIQKQSLRQVPPEGHSAREARGHRSAGRLQERLPDQGLLRDDARSSSCRYNLEKPKYDVDECRQRGMTFAAPIKVIVRLVVWDVNEETGVQSIRDVKEQEVYFGEIPLMTENGTFIINGTERVIVSQLHRSPGVFFDHDKGKTHSSRQAPLHRPHHPVPRLVARLRVRPQGHPLRPHRPPPQAARDGAAARARLLDREELLNYFYDTETVFLEPSKKYAKSVEYDLLPGQRATRDIRHPETRRDPGQEEPQVHQARPSRSCRTRSVERAAGRGRTSWSARWRATTSSTRPPARSSSQCNEEVTEAKLDELREHGINEFKVLFIDNLNVGSYLRDTLIADKLQTPDEAIMEIYRRLRPGDPPTLETAQPSSTTCSSTPSATTSRRSAA